MWVADGGRAHQGGRDVRHVCRHGLAEGCGSHPKVTYGEKKVSKSSAVTPLLLCGDGGTCSYRTASTMSFTSYLQGRITTRSGLSSWLHRLAA